MPGLISIRIKIVILLLILLKQGDTKSPFIIKEMLTFQVTSPPD